MKFFSPSHQTGTHFHSKGPSFFGEKSRIQNWETKRRQNFEMLFENGRFGREDRKEASDIFTIGKSSTFEVVNYDPRLVGQRSPNVKFNTVPRSLLF